MTLTGKEVLSVITGEKNAAPLVWSVQTSSQARAKKKIDKQLETAARARAKQYRSRTGKAAPVQVFNLCDYESLYLNIIDEHGDTVLKVEFDRVADNGVSITFDGFARGTKTGAALVCDVDAPANRKKKKLHQTIDARKAWPHSEFSQLKGKGGAVLFTLHQDSTSESLSSVKVEVCTPELDRDAHYTFIAWNDEQEVNEDAKE